MNQQKVKHYNQILLAVLGTVVLITAIMALFGLGFFFVVEISRSFRNNYEEEGILSEVKLQELQKENKRQQLISYEFPILVDSSNLVYMVPVSYKNLSEPEQINEGPAALLDISGSYNSNSRFQNLYYGSFNNLLIYDINKNKTKKIFEERVNFVELGTQYFDDDILIFFKAAGLDTNRDGLINFNDYKALYIYSLRGKSLKVIESKGADIFNFNFVHNSKNLIIQFGKDQNKDGTYDDYDEPTFIKKYEYATGELIDIVDKGDHLALQNSLDGSKKE